LTLERQKEEDIDLHSELSSSKEKEEKTIVAAKDFFLLLINNTSKTKDLKQPNSLWVEEEDWKKFGRLLLLST
jgi:hypothetical protein